MVAEFGVIHTAKQEHQDEFPLGKVKQGFSLGPLVTPWFGVSDLQVQETIQFCSLRHPVCSNLCLKLKQPAYPSKLYILVVLNLQCLIVLKSTILVPPKYQGKTNNRREMIHNLYEKGFDIRGAREMGKKPPVDKA